MFMISNENGKIELEGWAENVRNLGGLAFITVRDINGRYQVTVSKNSNPEIFEKINEIKAESVIKAVGEKKENAKAVNGYEIIPEKLEIITTAEQPVPLNLSEKVQSSLDKEIDFRFLSLRKPKTAAIFKIQSTVSNAITKFFEDQGFYQIHSSKIISQATEGGANVFQVLYFDKTAFLAQSPQFYKQMMMAAGFEKVFEIGPVFRAEPHHTSRHLTEYTSVDLEMSFIKSYEDVMSVMEKLILRIFKEVRERNKNDLELYGIKLDDPQVPFPRITIKEASEILKKYGNKLKDDGDIDPEGERIMGQYVKEKYNSDFFFLTEFPWSIAQFYHMKKEDNKEVTNRADLIYKGLEITTLAQREHRYDVLISQLKEKNLDPEKFKFYTDFFRYGVPPHGGSGTGLERIVKQMLNLENVAEATLLPRTPDRLMP
ncbi:MAG: aspartyl-tRNA synthetase [Candidatus Parvarchaeum acidiphilum ARMAN-4]|uniref:Aspartate--tRNA ligase n=1 Tax=Candidatus Parvarchaeum acidiphilum ARMAN-4 TaxID=662760 RepID=D2EF81_PARA4|nr:MAG: aspartyl-tRNA synthetase [Candidatus Parvarchaeum acidiphilum ARMAN-4]